MFDDPTLPKVIDFKEDDLLKKSFLIFEYFEGETFDSYVENNGKFDEDIAKIIFK